MIQHKCTQEQKITDLQKSFNDLDKRDTLQANENKNMSEQIKAIKDTVSNVENKLDKWFEEIKSRSSCSGRRSDWRTNRRRFRCN